MSRAQGEKLAFSLNEEALNWVLRTRESAIRSSAKVRGETRFQSKRGSVESDLENTRECNVLSMRISKAQMSRCILDLRSTKEDVCYP